MAKKKKKSTGNKRSAANQQLAVDSEGRMSEAAGRRFYALMDFLALLVVPRIRQEQLINKDMHWNPAGLASNSAETSAVVVDYILSNIESISQEVDAGQHDGLFRRAVGRSVTVADKKEIQSWKTHVSDDFFIVDHIPNKGSIFVQVGRIPSKNAKLEETGIILNEEDIHEPRVFLVQGLATPLRELCQPAVDTFAEKHPHIKHDLPVALLNVTLIPFNGGLTYGASMAPHDQHYYRSPESFSEATRTAVEAYRAAFSNATDSPKLYTTLKEADAPSLHRASNSESAFRASQNRVNESKAEKHMRDKKLPTVTTLYTALFVWTPVENVNDPRFPSLVMHAADGARPLPQPVGGFKRHTFQELLVKDDEPCPFHRKLFKGRPFKDCCKNDHLKRLKSPGIGPQGKEVYYYCPLGKEEAVVADRKAREGDPSFDHFMLSRLGENSESTVKIKVSPVFVPLLKERLDGELFFLATFHDQWEYLGHHPILVAGSGMMIFGDVRLDKSGLLQASAVTAERVEMMIHELRRIYDCIPVEEATITHSAYRKRKPDKDSLDKLVALVKESFDTEASFQKEKQIFGKVCAYCGTDEEAKLKRCACKSVYYCSKKHQKAHFPIHKSNCSAVAS